MIDLVQIIPELITNADAAIAASGRARGKIEFSHRTSLLEWRLLG